MNFSGFTVRKIMVFIPRWIKYENINIITFISGFSITHIVLGILLINCVSKFVA